MIRFLISIMILCLGLFFTGCEDNNLSQIDAKSKSPFLHWTVVSPDSVNLDLIAPVNGAYPISTLFKVQATDPDGRSDLDEVLVEVYHPTDEQASLEQRLHDDGVAPDTIAGDDIYSGQIQFDVIRASVGRYRIQSIARDRAGLRSNALSTTLFITRANSNPRTFNLSAPDTITRPSSGSLLFPFTVSVQDSDGYADIENVFFKRILPSPTSPIFMFDDGSRLTSGDQIAGDGIFTRIVRIDSSAFLGEQTFLFQARDRFGAFNDSLKHTITIIP